MKSLLTLSLALLLTAALPVFAQTGQTLEQIKAAADTGNPTAQDKLAEQYILRLDTTQAEFWYRKAAAQGYAHAQGKLADMLLNRARMSVGLKPDAKQAIGEEGVKWAILAANQGDQLGQAKLAEAYSEGKFVKQDWVQAYKWAALSADRPGSMFNPAGILAGSIRNSAILKLSDQQLAEARKLVADFSPHATAKSEIPTPAWVKEIKLSGLSGPAHHRLAIINNRTFGVGDENEVKLAGTTVKITCLAIEDDSVILGINGLPGRYQLTSSGQLINLMPRGSISTSLPKTPHTSQSTIPVIVGAVASPAQNASPSQPTQPYLDLNQVQFTSTSQSPTRAVFWMGIMAALLVGAAIGTFATLRWEHQRNLGEALVVDLIESCFAGPHLLLNNVTLPLGAGGSTQIDHVLVAPAGIFVIETKHYAGWIFGNPKDAQWTQQIYIKKSRFQNPLRQNYAHVSALQTLLSLPKDYFHSVIVFTGSAEFKTDLGPDVVRLNELPARLNAKQPGILDERLMAEVIGRIEMCRERRSLETDEYHINYLRGKLAKRSRSVQANPDYPLGARSNWTPSEPSKTTSPNEALHPHAKYMPKE